MKNFMIKDTGSFNFPLWGDWDGFFPSNSFGEGALLRTDIKEYPTHYLLEIEVAGISKNNIDLSLENGYLTVTCTKTDKNDGTVDDWKYVRRERAVSGKRVFYIGDVCENDIKATYTEGVLYIHLPKRVDDGDCSTLKKIEIH